MTNKYKHIFGPVASRRLGRSLGIDLIPFKTCTLDCVYCECGRTTVKTLERKDYFPPEEVLGELKNWKDRGGEADIVTLAGSGEPTLYKSLKTIIEGAKEITGLPVCLITNATLFYIPEVREAALISDVVMPSLDAADEKTFKRLNRPAPDLPFADYLDGLKAFCEAYRGKGRVDLEIFLVPGINDNEDQVTALSLLSRSLKVNCVQLNTAVRPPAEKDVNPIPKEEMEKWSRYFIPKAEVIASYHSAPLKEKREVNEEELLETLSHRIMSLEDLVEAKGYPESETEALLKTLLQKGSIHSRTQDGKEFFYV
ncbi:radical SAM protein [bacterium]|nr:radical SAM protein [bacterium]